MKQFYRYLNESLTSVLPISAIVLMLSVSVASLHNGVLVQFLFGTMLLILGMGFFTVGSGISMQPLGESIGAQIGRSKRWLIPLLISFLLGAIITIAEPDLQVLAEQVPTIPNMVLILCVAVGVGIFLMIATVRVRRTIPLSLVLLIFRRFHRTQLLRIAVGLVYTYLGLVLFLTGANVGFMPAGRLLGAAIAGKNYKYLLIPVGMLMGYFVVSAEPAVHSLKKQVEEVTNGAISQKSIGNALSIGVAVSVGISMLRILTGISILPFLIAGYAVSLIITFYVPHIYTGIAFDSGGVASGPMTTTFMLPFAVGACEVLGGNIMTDAFGIVAMIAMTPLSTIQVLGLYGRIKRKKRIQRVQSELLLIEDDIIFYDEEVRA